MKTIDSLKKRLDALEPSGEDNMNQIRASLDAAIYRDHRIREALVDWMKNETEPETTDLFYDGLQLFIRKWEAGHV